MNAKSTFPIEDILITTPENCWRAWIQAIANDPDMTIDRALTHLKKHISSHFDSTRFEEWLAGCYNLLAIVSCIRGTNPQYIIGADLLFRKWLSDPTNHTPPPTKKTKKVKQSKIYSSGS